MVDVHCLSCFSQGEGGREGFAPWQEGAKWWDEATEQHPASVRASTLEDRGLFSLFPLNCSVATFTILCRPAPSQVEFLWAPLKSMVCVVLCQEKAVLNENAILIIILFFPCEPRSPTCPCKPSPSLPHKEPALGGWGWGAPAGNGKGVGANLAFIPACPGSSSELASF